MAGVVAHPFEISVDNIVTADIPARTLRLRAEQE